MSIVDPGTTPAVGVSDPKASKTKSIAFGLIALILFGVLYCLALSAYHKEASASAAELSVGDTQDPNRLVIDATVLAVDPVKGDMSVRLSFEPKGNLVEEDGETLAKDVKIYTNSATGKQAQTFEKGEQINPYDIVLSLYEGQASDYPFDKHLAEFEVHVTSPAADEKGQATEVPTEVSFFGQLPGLRIDAAQGKDSTKTNLSIDATVTRSNTTLAFAIFGMLAMWGIAILVILMVMHVVMGNRKLELAMFALTATLLFSFFAFRNSMPGTPPIGTLSDFMAFFWAEAVAAGAMMTLILTWLLRPAK